MIFSSRREGRPDPFLDSKIQIFFGGGILALLGIGMESDLLVGVAIVVLLAGIVLRLLQRRKCDGEGYDLENGESHATEDPDSDSGSPSI